MEYRFETAYDQKTVTVMAKALRKTTRKKRSRRTHIFGAIVILLGLLLSLPLGNENFVVDAKAVITWLVVAGLFFTMVFEDRINGCIARKRMLPGLDRSTVTFREDGYHSETGIGTSEFKYSAITELAETADHFVFIFGRNHAQIYDKRTITGGTVEEFRAFIKHATGREIQRVS